MNAGTVCNLASPEATLVATWRLTMPRNIGFNERSLRKALGAIHKALILGTLGALVALSPFRGGRLSQNEVRHVARVTEKPDFGNQKILWLSASSIRASQEK
jgi:hypothetical protein